MDKGGQSPGAPKVLGAPEQCSKESNVDVSRTVIHVTFHSIKAHVIYPIMDTAIFPLQSQFEGQHLFETVHLLNLSDCCTRICHVGPKQR